MQKFNTNALNLVQNNHKFAQGRMQASNNYVRIRNLGSLFSKSFRHWLRNSPYLCIVKLKQLEDYGKDCIRNLGLGRRSIWRRHGVRLEDRRRNIGACIRCGDEGGALAVGHGNGIRYGRVRAHTGYAGAAVRAQGRGDFHEVHAADCGDLRKLGGEDGAGLDGAHGAGLHRHLLDSQPDGRGALDAGTDSVSNHNIKEIRRANEILGEAGFKVSAVQNHFSLLYRSSEKGGVLDYCREQGIEFWAYMVLEQGALSGKYNKENPLPAESDRGKKYNPVLDSQAR